MYFLVIFLANLLNTIIYLVSVRHMFTLPCHSKMLQLGEQDLKVVGLESQLLTSIMISRLVLNLRSVDDTTMHGDPTILTGEIRFEPGAVENMELNTLVDTSPTSLHRPRIPADAIPRP